MAPRVAGLMIRIDNQVGAGYRNRRSHRVSLGSDTFLYVALDGLETVLVRISGSESVEEGARIGLKFDESRMHFFDADDKAIR